MSFFVAEWLEILWRAQPEWLHDIKFTLRWVFSINLSITTGITFFMLRDLPADFLQHTVTHALRLILPF